MSRKVVGVAVLVMAASALILIQEISRRLDQASATKASDNSNGSPTGSSLVATATGPDQEVATSKFGGSKRDPADELELRTRPSDTSRRLPDAETSGVLSQEVGSDSGQDSSGQWAGAPPAAEQIQKMLLPYMMNLQSRARQLGMPIGRFRQVSAQVAAVAWRAQAAGVPPVEAVGRARFFGEKALESFAIQQKKLSVMGGAGTQHAGDPNPGIPPLAISGSKPALRQRQQ